MHDLSMYFNTANLQQTRETSFEYVDGEYKMVLVVRNDLKMGKGKVAAQVYYTNKM